MEKVISKVGFDRGIKMGEGSGLLFLVGSPECRLLGKEVRTWTVKRRPRMSVGFTLRRRLNSSHSSF